MAITKFAGVKFDPELFMEYMEEFSPEPVAFLNSGIIRRDTEMQNSFTEGNLVTAPFFKPLTGASQNYDGTDIVVNDITSGAQSAVVIGRTKAWGTQDLAAELASKDPQRSIAAKVAKYWQEEWQRIIINEMNGIFKGTNMDTHVHDVSIQDGDNATAANKMSSDAIIDGLQKSLGDNAAKVTTMSVHSKVYSTLQKLNLIEYEKLSDQELRVPFFLDKRVIVDDAHTVIAGTTSGKRYVSYLYAPNALGTANGRVKTPVETDRDSLKDGGSEWLVNRLRRVYHMYGVNFKKASMATISPTDAELATAGNWEKVYLDKNIPVVQLITN